MLNYLKTIDIDNLKDNEYLTFNFEQYKINKVEPNIYSFSTIYKDYYFIKIKDELIELDNLDLFITLHYEYDDYNATFSHQDYINEFKQVKVKSDNECLTYYVDSHFLSNEPKDCLIDYYCIFEIDEEHYLGVTINYANSFQTCKFNKGISCYILNKDLSKKYALQFKSNALYLLSKLFNTTNNFKKHVQLFNLKLTELIEDKSKLELFNIFDNTPYKSLIMKNIDTLINPILQEGNVKAYFNDFPMFFNKSLNIINVEEANDKFISKAESIARYLIGESYIDVFTGEIIEKNFKLYYKDPEYIIIHVESTGFKYIYENIDNIYCPLSNDDKISEAHSRAKLVNLLCCGS